MSFVQYHLAITKNSFKHASHQLPDNFALKECPLTWETFEPLMVKVGKPYDWQLRDEYHDEEKQQRIIDTFNENESRLWLFQVNGKDVGFCAIANIEPKSNLKTLFGEAAIGKKVTEIYKIGLFPEYTASGYGSHFLNAVLRRLLTDKDSEHHSDIMYLNTRNTNHNRVIPFYEKNNIKVIHQEICKDDLIITSNTTVTPQRPMSNKLALQ